MELREGGELERGLFISNIYMLSSTQVETQGRIAIGHAHISCLSSLAYEAIQIILNISYTFFLKLLNSCRLLFERYFKM